MTLDSKHIARALDLIFETTEQELDCDELQSLLAEYVQFEVAGGNPAKKFPAVAAHLFQCADCTEDYQGLLDVARLETQDRLPHPDRVLKQFPETEAVSKGTEIVLEVQSELVPVAGR